MYVADLRDAKAMKLLGQARQSYVEVLGNQILRFQKKRVSASNGCNRRGTNQKLVEKFSACQQFWPWLEV
jgi:hypothetical protein